MIYSYDSFWLYILYAGGASTYITWCLILKRLKLESVDLQAFGHWYLSFLVVSKWYALIMQVGLIGVVVLSLRPFEFSVLSGGFAICNDGLYAKLILL